MYSYSGCCLISHYSKLIAGKLAGKKKKSISGGREATSLGNKRRFSPGRCGAVMNTTASLSLIRPQLVSLWDGPPSKTPWPPPAGVSEGPQQILQKPPFFLPLPSSHSSSPPPDSHHPSIPQSLWWRSSPSVEMLKKGPESVEAGVGWGAARTRHRGENNVDTVVNKIWKKRKSELKETQGNMRKRKRRKWGVNNRLSWAWGYQGAPLFVIPPDSPPPSPFAPTDRTHWPVFNKASVLGRFLWSSINCSRGVTQDREWVREIESVRGRLRGRERERERDGKNEKRGEGERQRRREGGWNWFN